MRVLYVTFDGREQSFHQFEHVLRRDHLLHPHQAVTFALGDAAAALDEVHDLLPHGVIFEFLFGSLAQLPDQSFGAPYFPICNGILKLGNGLAELDPFFSWIGGLDLGQELRQADLDQSEIFTQVEQFGVMNRFRVFVGQGTWQEFCSAISCHFKNPFINLGRVYESTRVSRPRPSTAVPHADFIAR